jgi:hypothetical protein
MPVDSFKLESASVTTTMDAVVVIGLSDKSSLTSLFETLVPFNELIGFVKFVAEGETTTRERLVLVIVLSPTLMPDFCDLNLVYIAADYFLFVKQYMIFINFQ